MSLCRESKDECGNTNIDFRTKCEKENLELYEPWALPKDFGTMGRFGYTPSYTQLKKIFSISPNSKLKNIIHSSQNPKEYPMEQYYKKNNIKPYTISQFNVDRFAQLDESYVGKDDFTVASFISLISCTIRHDVNTHRYKCVHYSIYS